MNQVGELGMKEDCIKRDRLEVWGIWEAMWKTRAVETSWNM